MKILLDSNVLIRVLVHDSPQREPLKALLLRERAAGNIACVAPQSLYEFWSVATRPKAANGLALLPTEAASHLQTARETFTILSDPRDLFDRWLALCVRYFVLGRPSHDARLVAFMLGHDIEWLITLNPGDFARYAEIECVTA